MNDAEKLNDLRRHWGSAYNIDVAADGVWVAWRHAILKDKSELLFADTAAELRQLIRRDYDVATGVSPSTR